MITITAFKWVPPFAQGQVRDHRLRWMLNELGWPYQVRLIDAPEQRSEHYRRLQPFGQVPVLEEAGRPPMFESGAVVLDLALRSGRLLPADESLRGQALCFYFAALNSVEPFLMALAEVEHFLQDADLQQRRRPAAQAMARQRLGELQAAIGDREFLVGGAFSIADLMTASVLKIAESLRLLGEFASLAAYQARMLERPAYRRAVADQLADFSRHSPADMKYG